MSATPQAARASERSLPVRIRIAIPPEGLGRQLDHMTAWLDANFDHGSWSITPSGTCGVANDALAIYFADAVLARAFVTRWCIGCRIEPADGMFESRRFPE